MTPARRAAYLRPALRDDAAAETPAERGRTLSWAGPAAVTALYAAIVIWTAVHHEPWRDEVVPLSIARAAGSLRELAAPLRFESHPILWYLVLWAAWAVVGQTWVLKAASLGSAIGAIALFSWSPVAWWLRVAFTFSFFPLWQYSVVSRGYGLEMLMLFAFCALYPHRRAHPMAVAFALAGLANTEAFGLVMALGAGTMLAVEAVLAGNRRPDRSVLAGVLVYACGLALSVFVAWPDAAHRGSGIGDVDGARLAAAVAWSVAAPAGWAASITPLPLPSLWVWAYFVYLIPRPAVLAFTAASLVGLQVLFNVIRHLHAPWHLGSIMLVLVAAMWLDASRSGPALGVPPRLAHPRVWLGRVLAAGMTLVLLEQAYGAWQHVAADLRYEHSSNERLAALIASEPALAGAVVLGEPDTPPTSLPYYADNPVYLPREQAYRGWGVFAPPRQVDYDLAALLATARRLRAETGKPVVVTLGWEIGQPGRFTSFGGSRFEEHFVITPAARDEFLAAVRPVARLRGPTITDENYDVFVLP